MPTERIRTAYCSPSAHDGTSTSMTPAIGLEDSHQ